MKRKQLGINRNDTTRPLVYAQSQALPLSLTRDIVYLVCGLATHSIDTIKNISKPKKTFSNFSNFEWFIIGAFLGIFGYIFYKEFLKPLKNVYKGDIQKNVYESNIHSNFSKEALATREDRATLGSDSSARVDSIQGRAMFPRVDRIPLIYPGRA